MYKLIFAPEFVNDLEETNEYIASTLESPDAAKSIMKEIDDTIMKLKDMPFMFPKCDEPLDVFEYRKIIIKNYILIYYVDESQNIVNLLRCFYGKSNYLDFFNGTGR